MSFTFILDKNKSQEVWAHMKVIKVIHYSMAGSLFICKDVIAV